MNLNQILSCDIILQLSQIAMKTISMIASDNKISCAKPKFVYIVIKNVYEDMLKRG